MATYITNTLGKSDDVIPDPKIIDQLKQFGLLDILTSAASVHINNAEILPIIECALDIINPKAENILEYKKYKKCMMINHLMHYY